MFDLKMMIVAGIACAVGGTAFGARYVGYPMGKAAEKHDAHAKPSGEYYVLEETSKRLIKERDQARAEVDKVNQESERQRAENRRIEDDDRTARAIAVSRAEASAKSAAFDAQATKQRIEEGRNALAKLADVCVSSGTPADFVRVLNDAIARATGLEGDGAVSGVEADHRSKLQGNAADVRASPSEVSVHLHTGP